MKSDAEEKKESVKAQFDALDRAICEDREAQQTELESRYDLWEEEKNSFSDVRGDQHGELQPALQLTRVTSALELLDSAVC